MNLHIFCALIEQRRWGKIVVRVNELRTCHHKIRVNGNNASQNLLFRVISLKFILLYEHSCKAIEFDIYLQNLPCKKYYYNSVSYSQEINFRKRRWDQAKTKPEKTWKEYVNEKGVRIYPKKGFLLTLRN